MSRGRTRRPAGSNRDWGEPTAVERAVAICGVVGAPLGRSTLAISDRTPELPNVRERVEVDGSVTAPTRRPAVLHSDLRVSDGHTRAVRPDVRGVSLRLAGSR